MKCSQIKCIVNMLVGHREARLGRMFLKRPDGVVCEQAGAGQTADVLGAAPDSKRPDLRI